LLEILKHDKICISVPNSNSGRTSPPVHHGQENNVGTTAMDWIQSLHFLLKSAIAIQAFQWIYQHLYIHHLLNYFLCVKHRELYIKCKFHIWSNFNRHLRYSDIVIFYTLHFLKFKYKTIHTEKISTTVIIQQSCIHNRYAFQNMQYITVSNISGMVECITIFLIFFN